MLSGRNYEGIWEASHRDQHAGLKYGLGFGDMLGTMDKVQSHDEETQGSGSGSGFSDLSALENETDDFGRRLLQHQRDAQRLQAIRGNQQAFRKARPRPRITDLLEREEREARQRERDRQSNQKSGSDESNELEPAVTIPREWGRKAKRQTDWMRKILEPPEPSENGEAGEGEDGGAIFPHRTGFTGDLDWRADAEQPRRSIEQTPREREFRPSTPPSSLRHMNTTLRHNTDSDDGIEFSSASLLTSTPARTRLPRKIDELARREIESLEQQGVISRALEQMEQRSPNGTLRRTSSSDLRQRAIAGGLSSGQQDSSNLATTSSRIPRRSRRSQEGNQENVAPNGETDVNGDGRKVGEATGLMNRTNLPVSIKRSQRPTHQRNDSMNLLRKLARVSSLSPSPASDKRNDALGEDDEKAAVSNMRPLSADAAGVADAKPASQTSDRGMWRFGALRSAHTVNGEGNMQGKQDDSDAEDVTPAPTDEMADAKTPVVTGAWVDTMLQVDGRPTEDAVETEPKQSKVTAQAEREQAADEELRRVKSEPTRRPQSALSAILRDSKREQQDQVYGESTIQSLEDIVDPHLDQTDPTITFDLDAAKADEDIDEGQPLTQDEKNRRQESLAIEGLNKHLRAARTSIKDANKGLRRVEHRIETVQDAPLPTMTAADLKTTVVVVQKSGKHGFVPCETCGGGYNSVWYALWAEFRSCFYTWDLNYKYRLRLTSLGLWCLCWLVWYIIENVLCAIYCHPFVTTRRQYTVDPWNTPRYPFVIPTFVIGRPLRWLLGDDLWYDIWQFLELFWEKEIFQRFITGGDPCYGKSLAVCNPYAPRRTIVMSTSVFSTPSRNQWAATATATAARVARSFVDAVDEVGSMWDDEMVL